MRDIRKKETKSKRNTCDKIGRSESEQYRIEERGAINEVLSRIHGGENEAERANCPNYRAPEEAPAARQPVVREVFQEKLVAAEAELHEPSNVVHGLLVLVKDLILIRIAGIDDKTSHESEGRTQE